jgi:hypothetical protein
VSLEILAPTDTRLPSSGLKSRRLHSYRIHYMSFTYLSNCSVRRFEALTLGFEQIAITSSTSAGLEQILPWLYYHRTIGVTHFFLFVEGKAASLNSTSVLEAIPVCALP